MSAEDTTVGHGDDSTRVHPGPGGGAGSGEPPTGQRHPDDDRWSRANRWLVLGITGAVALLVALLVVLVFGGADGDRTDRPTTTTTSVERPVSSAPVTTSTAPPPTTTTSTTELPLLPSLLPMDETTPTT